MQQTGLQQNLHDLRNTASLMQINGQIFAAGFQVANHRNLFAHALEVVNGPWNFSGVRNGQEVQHSIGRTASGHDHGHGIFNGLFGHDVAWLQIILNGFQQNLGRCFGRVLCFIVGVGHGRRVGQRHAQRFKRRRHGVGCVHTTA